jgi:carboxypeptidase T
MHGIEVIGSLALLEVVRSLGVAGDRRAEKLLDQAHFVVVPIVNPDAFEANMIRVAGGRPAWQRCNANGVDLNRNFPRQTTKNLRHPFSGSRFRASPHYLGPHALSEPESRTIFRIAQDSQPILSLAFHSFGNLLLYPWAYTHHENPRAGEYRSLASTLIGSVDHMSYSARQARQLYSVLGDMDDWLDAEHGSLALTIEVGRPDVRWRDGRDLVNPFRWMNPVAARETVENLTPGVVALMSAALGLEMAAIESTPSKRHAKPLDFAAK